MTGTDKCPKCDYCSDTAFEECPKCGIIVKKFIEAQKRQEKQKKIEELEKKLHKIEKIYTPSKPRNLCENKKSFVNFIKGKKSAILSNPSNLIEKIKPSLNFINFTLIAILSIFLLAAIISMTSDHKETSTVDWVSKCGVYYKEMERANYAYLYGGGTKPEFEEARRRWQECVLRNK